MAERSGQAFKRSLWRIALAMLMCSYAASAHAYSCSIADIAQAGKDTFNSAPASCASQTANPVFYALTAYLIAATQAPEGKQFCAAVEDAKDSASDTQKKVAGYWDKLSADQQAKLEQYVPAIASASSGAAELTDGLDLVSCACQVAQWKGPAALYGALSNCVASALCEAQDWFHDNVSSAFASCEDGEPPPPPQLIDCRPDPTTKNTNDAYWSFNYSIPVVGEEGQCFDKYSNGSYVTGYHCEGSFCFANSIASKGTGNYCYCPPGMQHANYFMQDVGSCYQYLTCGCPSGTEPLSDQGAGAYVCMCPDGMPLGPDGVCMKPPPVCDFTCPAGQVVHDKDPQTCAFTCGCPEGENLIGDKCLAPCADPTQVMLGNGQCCNPAQAAACGECCPSGMVPDATSGNCVAPPPKPAPSRDPVRPQKIIPGKITPKRVP